MSKRPREGLVAVAWVLLVLGLAAAPRRRLASSGSVTPCLRATAAGNQAQCPCPELNRWLRS